jgi:hypothetical protein
MRSIHILVAVVQVTLALRVATACMDSSRWIGETAAALPSQRRSADPKIRRVAYLGRVLNLSLRKSSAWPVLSDPWFVTRVLAPMCWWTNPQLGEFAMTYRSDFSSVTTNANASSSSDDSDGDVSVAGLSVRSRSSAMLVRQASRLSYGKRRSRRRLQSLAPGTDDGVGGGDGGGGVVGKGVGKQASVRKGLLRSGTVAALDPK